MNNETPQHDEAEKNIIRMIEERFGAMSPEADFLLELYAYKREHERTWLEQRRYRIAEWLDKKGWL